VDENFDVYVSDFAFARQKENKNSKGFTTTHVGPIKWEAPREPAEEGVQREDGRLLVRSVFV
jgi:hypothetical protein